VLLAERHHDLRDGIRGLLETAFETIFMVANEASLLEGAGHLQPTLAILDISLSGGDLAGFLARVSERAPLAKILLLSVHDEPTVAEAALQAGANGVVLKRCLSTDLMPAVEALLAGQRYLSQGISLRNDEEQT
jgi:two-component system, NarL family, nitrate/nitrite response regulator NarL